jgi:putative NIF3 family GTP cyclohydrolase 1 type 2
VPDKNFVVTSQTDVSAAALAKRPGSSIINFGYTKKEKVCRVAGKPFLRYTFQKWYLFFRPVYLWPHYDDR